MRLLPSSSAMAAPASLLAMAMLVSAGLTTAGDTGDAFKKEAATLGQTVDSNYHPYRDREKALRELNRARHKYDNFRADDPKYIRHDIRSEKNYAEFLGRPADQVKLANLHKKLDKAVKGRDKNKAVIQNVAQSRTTTELDFHEHKLEEWRRKRRGDHDAGNDATVKGQWQTLDMHVPPWKQNTKTPRPSNLKPFYQGPYRTWNPDEEGPEPAPLSPKNRAS